MHEILGRVYTNLNLHDRVRVVSYDVIANTITMHGLDTHTTYVSPLDQVLCVIADGELVDDGPSYGRHPVQLIARLRRMLS